MGSASVDLEKLQRYRAAVAGVLCPRWNDMEPDVQGALSDALAHEVAAFPAVQGVRLVRVSDRTRSGPKPPAATMAFAATVRALLAEHGHLLAQWRNGRGESDELDDLCREITQACGLPWPRMSARTGRALPEEGWKR